MGVAGGNKRCEVVLRGVELKVRDSGMVLGGVMRKGEKEGGNKMEEEQGNDTRNETKGGFSIGVK